MASRPFMDLLREQRGGVLHDELSDALQELVVAVEAEGKAGTLTLSLTLKPAANVDGALVLTDKVAIKKPQASRRDSIFFVTPECNLSRDNPRQTTLELREVNAPRAPREIGSAS